MRRILSRDRRHPGLFPQAGKGFLLLLCFAILGGGVPARAEFSASGYLKDIQEYTRSAFTHSPYYLNLTRARLTLDESEPIPEHALRAIAHADYDHELRTGTFLQSADYRFFGLGEQPYYLNLDRTIGRGNSYFYRYRFYRAYAGIESEESIVRLGRQRVAWGTGKLWNPTDVLNPYVPTTIERDERQGVDALYLRRGVGALGQTEAAYGLGSNWSSSNLLARIHGNLRDVDVSLMGGKVAASTSSWMAGSDFSANLWDGNIHGEWSYSTLVLRTPYWRALIGYEYSFSSNPPVPGLKDAWVLVEYFHNGAGATNSLKYQFAQVLSGQTISLAQNYMGFGFQKDLHPLVKLELYEIRNLDDGSDFFGPTLTWNALKNLYVSAGWERFGGAPKTEYGRLPNVGFFQGQYYF